MHKQKDKSYEIKTVNFKAKIGILYSWTWNSTAGIAMTYDIYKCIDIKFSMYLSYHGLRI